MVLARAMEEQSSSFGPPLTRQGLGDGEEERCLSLDDPQHSGGPPPLSVSLPPIPIQVSDKHRGWGLGGSGAP